MTDRTALVTGSARRVGRRIAELLLADGWDVVVHATDGERARAAAAELGATAGVGADLADPDAIAQLAAATAVAFPGGLDLLVNNAASFEHVARWQDVDLASWARAMDVNARAPYLLIQALLPSLTQARGCVVNVSDRAAHDHWTTFPIHAASKAALESITISGSRALAREGVRVNAVVPATILPPDTWTEARIEQERVAGKLDSPDSLADAIRELAADSNRTGEIVHL
jgi:pteridine reductase